MVTSSTAGDIVHVNGFFYFVELITKVLKYLFYKIEPVKLFLKKLMDRLA